MKNLAVRLFAAKIWPRSMVLLLLLAVFYFLFHRPGATPTTATPPHSLLRGETMGTTYSIRFVSQANIELKSVHAAVEAELKLVNQQMSTYIPDSEITRFNDSSSLDWFSVSPETAQVVALAQLISEDSAGAFDVTVGPIVDLWGFGPVKRADRVPSEEEIQNVLTAVGFRKLSVMLDPPALKKSVPKLRVDLSAIAKGHGSDRVGKVLRSFGIQNFFVEIGGEIITAGRRADGRDWQVGIEAPLEHERGLQTVVGLTDAGIATSGDYRNFFEADGQKFSHTIDPATGRPTRHELASASVIADNCALADAIATSMMALGPEKGLELAQRKNWQVMLICRDKDQFTIKRTTEFERRFPDHSSKPSEQ